MRKTLLVAAIMGGLVPSWAHAQSSNVSLYGALNLSPEVIINVKQGNTSTGPGTPPPGGTENLYRVSSNLSLLGFRGTESLGGGLSAIFQIESAVQADISGGVLASRDTFVGLQGPWGTVRLGYFFAPYYNYGVIFGNVPTFRAGILSSASLYANNGYVGASTETGSFAQRDGNSVRYDSPNLGGFIGTVMVAVRDAAPDPAGGTVAQAQRHAYVLSTGGQYNNGPIAAALAFETHNKLRDGTPANPNMNDQGILVTGSYDFEVVKVAAAYEALKYDVPTGGDLKRNYWAISVTGSVGGGLYYAAYWKASNGSGSANCATAAGITSCPRIGALTLGPDTGAQQWEVSYTYPLSKRTLLYAGYTMIDNQKNAAYNFGLNQVSGICAGNAQNAQGNNIGCGDAGKPQGLTVGIYHSF